MNKNLKILAIESSCDETAAAVVKFAGKAVIEQTNVVSSQVALHEKTQGVVPEVAARAHLRNIGGVVHKALADKASALNSVDYIAVTVGPGLITSLMVGAEYAKGLALAANKKIVPVNHMLGHLYSAFLQNPEIKFPAVNLIVSGGHTYLVLLRDRKNYSVIGQTVDDAVGEAFDKTAKMLGLPYPGGPRISEAALRGKRDYQFPRPMIHSGDFEFSFAGLKTAVLYKIRDEKLNIRSPQVVADIAMSFQNAAVDVLVRKTLAAAKKFGAKSITLSGGVAANKKLRADLKNVAKKFGADFYVPELSLCTDNALMIANAAAIMLQNGFKPVGFEKIRVNPNLEL